MRVRNYIKSKCEQTVSETFEEDVNIEEHFCKNFNITKTTCGVILLSVLALFTAVGIIRAKLNNIATTDIVALQAITAPLTATASTKSIISIPAGTVKANPFLPYRNLSGDEKVLDVPAYNLIEPPEVINTHSDAARVMDTIVSGILYDKYSPSAILNIEGNDYLVKKGDVVNNYKVLNIAQDSVTVKLGTNVYKAGIGEILTEGTLNYNNVSNLGNKFGGGNNELQ